MITTAIVWILAGLTGLVIIWLALVWWACDDPDLEREAPRPRTTKKGPRP